MVNSKDTSSGFEDSVAYLSAQDTPIVGPALTPGTKVTLVGVTSTGVAAQGTIHAPKDLNAEFSYVHHVQMMSAPFTLVRSTLRNSLTVSSGNGTKLLPMQWGTGKTLKVWTR